MNISTQHILLMSKNIVMLSIVFLILSLPIVDASDSDISEKRKEWLDYTHPVETFNINVFVRKTTCNINSLEDLTGHRVAVQRERYEG